MVVPFVVLVCSLDSTSKGRDLDLRRRDPPIRMCCCVMEIIFSAAEAASRDRPGSQSVVRSLIVCVLVLLLGMLTSIMSWQRRVSNIRQCRPLLRGIPTLLVADFLNMHRSPGVGRPSGSAIEPSMRCEHFVVIVFKILWDIKMLSSHRAPFVVNSFFTWRKPVIFAISSPIPTLSAYGLCRKLSGRNRIFTAETFQGALHHERLPVDELRQTVRGALEVDCGIELELELVVETSGVVVVVPLDEVPRPSRPRSTQTEGCMIDDARETQNCCRPATRSKRRMKDNRRAHSLDCQRRSSHCHCYLELDTATWTIRWRPALNRLRGHGGHLVQRSIALNTRMKAVQLMARQVCLSGAKARPRTYKRQYAVD
ncbi:hypothetical protein KCU88_g418, partial [Aureobasidium melanogenum]